MADIISKKASPFDIYQLGQPHSADDWLVSDWNAGQSSSTKWSPNNVRVAANGQVELVLTTTGSGSERAVVGAEIQNTTAATTGTWSWTTQAPEMVPGAVFGMFIYKSDWKNQPWVEFDFEFVGADTTKVQLNIHMEDAQGRHVVLDETAQGRTIIDLGFDAAEGLHTYEVTVTERDATFYIDGKVVGVFKAGDMQGNVWNIGPMNSFVDLWAVGKGQEAWAGKWQGLDTPLLGKVSDAEIRPGEFGSNYDPNASVPPGPSADGPYPEDDTSASNPDVLPADAPHGSIIGQNSDDHLQGNASANTIFGFAGNDTLDGRGGADVMYGMTGDDIYFVSQSHDQTIEFVDSGRDTVYATVNWTLAENIEDLFLDTSAGRDATGNSTDNRLTGNAGSDVLSGLAGNDTLNGGAGRDVMYGGLQNDTYVVNMIGDRVVELAGQGTDLVLSSINFGLGTNVERLTLTGTTNLNGTGNTEANTLAGNVGANKLSGRGGDDSINGGAGDDSLSGGAGHDRLLGGTGRDLLEGGAGNDLLIGSTGGDRLSGGAGADVFVFQRTKDSTFAAGGRDVIGDFTHAQNDKIDLHLIDAHLAQAGNQNFDFIGGAAFSGKAGELAARLVAGGTLISSDLDGDKRLDFAILLDDRISLAASDFIL